MSNFKIFYSHGTPHDSALSEKNASYKIVYSKQNIKNVTFTYKLTRPWNKKRFHKQVT